MESSENMEVFIGNQQKVAQNEQNSCENAPKTLAEARKVTCIWQNNCLSCDCDECQHYCPCKDGWAKEHFEIMELLENWHDWLESWNDFVEKMGVVN